MPSIREIRKKVQSPRRHVDAAYGLVMRRFSAYLTWISFHAGLTPNQVTFISLLAMLSGVFFAFVNHSVFAWILGANLWYLIDHVDGELARLKNLKSNTGFYFDTVLNFIVQPLFFITWGYVILPAGEYTARMGWITAASYSILSILPVTEEAIRYSILKQGGSPVNSAAEIQKDIKPSIAKTVFMGIHKTVLFPNILMVATLISFTGLRNYELMQLALMIFLFWCGGIASIVWIAQLAHSVLSKKLDRVDA